LAEKLLDSSRGATELFKNGTKNFKVEAVALLGEKKVGLFSPFFLGIFVRGLASRTRTANLTGNGQ